MKKYVIAAQGNIVYYVSSLDDTSKWIQKIFPICALIHDSACFTADSKTLVITKRYL